MLLNMVPDYHAYFVLRSCPAFTIVPSVLGIRAPQEPELPLRHSSACNQGASFSEASGLKSPFKRRCLSDLKVRPPSARDAVCFARLLWTGTPRTLPLGFLPGGVNRGHFAMARATQ